MSQPLVSIRVGTTNSEEYDIDYTSNEDDVWGTADDGFYGAYYFDMDCTAIIASTLIGISLSVPTHVYAQIPFGNFNPKSYNEESISYYPATSFGVYKSVCSSVFPILGGGTSLTSIMTEISISSIFNSIALPIPSPVDIIFSTIKLNAQGYLYNGTQPVPLSDITEYGMYESTDSDIAPIPDPDPANQLQNQYIMDFDGDKVFDTITEEGNTINVYLSKNPPMKTAYPTPPTSPV